MNTLVIPAVKEESLTLDKIVPRWAQLLNRVYNTVFGPINRALAYLEVHSTKQMIAEFEAAEKINAAQKN